MALFGNHDLNIDSLTIGIDANGMANYRESLRIAVINETVNKLDNDWEPVEEAINDCWQGESRDRFLRDFKNIREKIKDDLTAEYRDLENRLLDLENMYFKQDQNMIIE